MERALRLHELKSARVIPVYVRVTDVKGSNIEELQGLPDERKPISKWSDADEAWKNVVDGLRLSIAEFLKEKPMDWISRLPKFKYFIFRHPYGMA